MTLPDEEGRSLILAGDFLMDLLDPKKTPKVPKAIRLRARDRLRHYPPAYKIRAMIASHYGEEVANLVRPKEE